MTGQTLKYARISDSIRKQRQYMKVYYDKNKERIKEINKSKPKNKNSKERIRIIDENWKNLGYYIEPD